MFDSPFIKDFRALLEKHAIAYPEFAYGRQPFNPAKPKVYYSGPVFDAEEMVAAVSALVEGKWSVGGEKMLSFWDFGHTCSRGPGFWFMFACSLFRYSLATSDCQSSKDMGRRIS